MRRHEASKVISEYLNLNDEDRALVKDRLFWGNSWKRIGERFDMTPRRAELKFNEIISRIMRRVDGFNSSLRIKRWWDD